ncbi:MAG: hypothetical protein NVSMB52_03660 [Chloroflexota bacterium]
MIPTTWIAYTDLGDDIVIPVGESADKYAIFLRTMRKEHGEVLVLCRPNFRKRYPAALEDFDHDRKRK